MHKLYTVFVAAVAPAARMAFRPRLNREHTEWRWLPLADLLTAQGGGGGGAGAGSNALDLHPVLQKLAQQHPAALRAAGGL
jgi:hypothetical protein